MLRRIGFILGLLVLLALAAAWVNSYGEPLAVEPETPGRDYSLAAHRGRIVFATSELSGPSDWRLRLRRHAVGKLDPYIPPGRPFIWHNPAANSLTIVAFPIWLPMAIVGGWMAWRWRKGKRQAAGFPVERPHK